MKYLGIDIGGTNLKAGIVDERGTIQRSKAVSTPTNFEEFSNLLKQLVGEIIADEQIINSVGIGCKGIINPVTTEVEICPGTFSFLEKHRLADLVADSLQKNTRIFADNDARAALVGEATWGAAQKLDNALMLTLGTGLGGAILAEGKIVRGRNGVAGHLGHMTIEPDGKMCFCGNRGCLETIFSARAIEGAAIESILRGCESALSTRFDSDPKNLTCLDVFKAAQEGDLTSEVIIKKAIFTLGAGIAGLLHIFDPEILIISGNIAQADDFLFDLLAAEVYQRTKRWIPNPVPIIKPQVGDTTGIVGAAALGAQKSLNL